jgi:hypothetical protein
MREAVFMAGRPSDPGIPLPQVVLEQLAAIPLDELMSTIDGLKSGAVRLEIAFVEGADADGAASGSAREASGEENRAMLLLFENELKRRRQ